MTNSFEITTKDGMVTSRRTIKPLSKKDWKVVEKIFKISLEDRTWSIELTRRGAVVTFFDKDNIFGFMECMPVQEFINKLDEFDRCINLKIL